MQLDPRPFTYTQLWVMSRGLQRAQRANLVSQAALVWPDDKLDIEGFIETGSFGDTTKVLDYDPAVRQAFIDKFMGKATEETTS